MHPKAILAAVAAFGAAAALADIPDVYVHEDAEGERGGVGYVVTPGWCFVSEKWGDMIKKGSSFKVHTFLSAELQIDVADYVVDKQQ